MAFSFASLLRPAPVADPLQQEAAQLNAFKDEALANAKDFATSEGRDKATLTDYFAAAHQLGIDRAGDMAKAGISWSPKVFADLSGRTLDGFQINRDDIAPPPGTTNRMTALLTQQQNTSPKTGVEALTHLEDLDGKHIVNDFYDQIQSQLRFDGTEFNSCIFHPASTYNPEITKGAAFHEVTFDGMREGDHIELGNSLYQDVRFTDIKGGHIDIADHAQIDGLNLDGAEASLKIGRCSISNLSAKDAHIISISATPGAEIHHSCFDGATIDMASEMKGIRMIDGSCTNTNLHSCDFSDGAFINYRFDGVDPTGMKLDRATLQNVSFQNINPGDLDLSKVARMENVTVNGQPVSSQQNLTMLTQLDSIRTTMQAAMASIGQTVEPPAPNAAPETARDAAQTSRASGIFSIAGGDHVEHDEIAMGTPVASQPRTVPVEHQATAANMQAIGRPVTA